MGAGLVGHDMTRDASRTPRRAAVVRLLASTGALVLGAALLAGTSSAETEPSVPIVTDCVPGGIVIAGCTA